MFVLLLSGTLPVLNNILRSSALSTIKNSIYFLTLMTKLKTKLQLTATMQRLKALTLRQSSEAQSKAACRGRMKEEYLSFLRDMLRDDIK